jgi:coenzyme F420-dependent glucose-6-phosphate dehydrogenase
VVKTPKIDVQLDLGENWYEPKQFVEALEYAEKLGFRTAWFGDHFVPWFHSGNQSQFVWCTLGAAMQKTSVIKTGPLVTSPIGGRYHPALVAQASATLDNLFPGRFLLGVGTGEALNEKPFWKGNWPKWEERVERLIEGVQLIRNLWNEKRPFSFEGKYFGSEFYFLYTKPKSKIPIYFSAIGKRTAFFAGVYGDKLVTISPRNDFEKLKREILPSYRKGLEQAGKQEGGVVVHLHFSFKSPEKLKEEEWRSLGWLSKNSWSIKDPIESEEVGKNLSLEEIKRGIHFLKGWNELVKTIEKYTELQIEAVVLVSEANKQRIKEIADNVLSVF